VHDCLIVTVSFGLVWFGFYVRGIYALQKFLIFCADLSPSSRALKIVFDENCCTNPNATEVERYQYGEYVTRISVWSCCKHSYIYMQACKLVLINHI